MTTKNNPGHSPGPNARAIASERCADCGATLVEDQRYCLQCGARRGLPRLDFTAFWKPAPLSSVHAGASAVSPTGAHAGGSGAPQDGSTQSGSAYGAWPGMPSRRVGGLLAAAVLAAGILVGAALGPTPPNSPADSSTLAERALAGLVASAGESQSVAPAPASTSTSASTPIAASTPSPQPAPTPVASSKASASSSPESPPPSESSSGASSEGTSSEGTSSEGSSSEGSSSEGSSKGSESAPGTPVKLPPVKHVWLISLSGASLVAAASQTQTDPYLAKQLLPKAALLSNYTLTAPSSLANGIALLSGQGVNLDTEQNCPTYSELQPPTVSATGLAEGVGCVYPTAVQTLADELTAAGLTWKAYVQSMEAGQASPSVAAAASCRHPEPGAPDPDQAASSGAPYLTFRNPFVYFHSLLDGGACASDDVDFARLQSDLATPANTPNLSWIVPSACDDGASAPCSSGAPAGLTPADDFLKEVVPQILATAAYREGGLIAIVPDSGPGPLGAATKPVGALLLSPFVHSGVHVTESLNDFSLLKSLSRLFGVLPLGHANDPSVASLSASVYGSSGKAAKSASTAKKAAQAAPTTPTGG